MDTITSKDVQNSLDSNFPNRSDERNKKHETTHLKLKYSKLPYKDSQAYDLVVQCKENSFSLLNCKRKAIRKEEIKQGKIF